MSTPPITYSGPVISPDVPFETRRHLQLLYQKLANHTQAFGLQQQAINTLKNGSTTTIVEGGGSGGGGSVSGSGVAVNNQSGVTSYATASGDDGALIVLSDASSIAVALSTQSPPWSCFFANQGSLGAGTATLTPDTGTISYAGHSGAASMPLLPTYCALLAFDGANWWAWTEPIVPVGFGAISHQFLTAYNAATGAFTAAAIAESDLPASNQAGVFGATIVASDVNKPQYVTVPFDCTITSWTIIADTSGSASIDVWFLAGSAPPAAPSLPTAANMISASAPITLTAAQTAAGGTTAVSTWTRPLTTWGTLAFNMTAIATSSNVKIQIQATRS